MHARRRGHRATLAAEIADRASRSARVHKDAPAAPEGTVAWPACGWSGRQESGKTGNSCRKDSTGSRRGGSKKGGGGDGNADFEESLRSVQWRECLEASLACDAECLEEATRVLGQLTVPAEDSLERLEA